MKEEFDTCSWCCEWVHEMEGKSPTAIRDAYPMMMRKVLVKEFCMSKRAAKNFISEACVGNWERLHETSVEKVVDAATYARELVSDIWYCSDRWSWDRLIRVQWLYKRLDDRCRRFDAR